MVHRARRIAMDSPLYAAAFVALMTTAGGCNHAPVADLEKSFTYKVQQNSGTSDPIKIDFLWVVDNSTSMCQEQLALTENFKTFTERLSSQFDIDPRLAVTTVDVQCTVNGTSIFSSQGLFNTVPARTFPPACQDTLVRACSNDAGCANLDCQASGECDDIDEPSCSCTDPDEWACRGYQSDICLRTPNGSINTSCRRRCTTDQECKDLFGDPRYICQKLSGNQLDWGCLLPPATQDCPATVPAILDGTNLDLFACAATVGVNQESSCFKYEQGLRASLLALDPKGKNAEQSKAFLRDDAYLVIIYVSDEDDCSVADGRSISEDDYETCALLPTTDEGGPLVPVGHYVNRLKGLKSDPGKVIVAAIAGDSTATDAASVAAERAAYLSSKGDPRTCYQQTYICNSAVGKADYGSRYLQLTQAFGPNGSFSNICEDQGIDRALENIADTIITVLNKLCLPRPVLGSLKVIRRLPDGSETEIPEGEGSGHYQILRTAEDCAVDGQLLPAIAFGDPPTPGEEIEVTYQGDPQFNQ
ncbi:MAG: hypothetical protein KC635_06505 [Myxococcales bacterium]|nr:hypothetical protein [Myxococcales bacterium]MCB9733479.1 hypothetical protein [Deltaproteobacteria bacterium]